MTPSQQDRLASLRRAKELIIVEIQQIEHDLLLEYAAAQRAARIERIQAKAQFQEANGMETWR